MPNNESPAARYRRLAGECLEVAQTLPIGERRSTLLQMAQVWQRLADDYAASTLSLAPALGAERPAMQQQQQIQSKDDDKKG